MTHRDGGQWILDYLVKTTGREQNFGYDTRKFPPEAKSYRMIPRVQYKVAHHQETMARAAEARGHRETALALYTKAVENYHHGQHALYYDDHPDKIFLYQRLTECYDRVMALSPHRIERIEVPWEGVSIQILLHLTPNATKAPTVLFCHGMDMLKEAVQRPEEYIRRGMNLCAMDGPGQGISNIRKIRVTADNYERAAKAVIEYLNTRTEVDPQRIAVVGSSMGSFWAMRTASTVPQLKAVAVSAACFGGMRGIFQEASPRFKRMFMYMAGLTDEKRFNEMATRMTVLDRAPSITCASLQVIGEYDPLCHLEDGYAVYEQLPTPKEFWVLENDFHATIYGTGNFGGVEPFGFMADWVRDALADRFPKDHARQVLVREKEGAGPYDPPSPGFWYPERAL
ncbi:MAG: alpha/beta hydrolase [Chloroflexota bacterium]|nr:alpha/beta hydrolase [Chloroflexota bacterium]